MKKLKKVLLVFMLLSCVISCSNRLNINENDETQFTEKDTPKIEIISVKKMGSKDNNFFLFYVKNNSDFFLKEVHAVFHGRKIIYNLGYYPFRTQFVIDFETTIKDGEFILFQVKNSNNESSNIFRYNMGG